MRREKILEVLSEGPFTVVELSARTGFPKADLRAELLRLQGEGKVESVQRGGELLWKVRKVSEEEQRYEKLMRKYVP